MTLEDAKQRATQELGQILVRLGELDQLASDLETERAQLRGAARDKRAALQAMAAVQPTPAAVQHAAPDASGWIPEDQRKRDPHYPNPTFCYADGTVTDAAGRVARLGSRRELDTCP